MNSIIISILKELQSYNRSHKFSLTSNQSIISIITTTTSHPTTTRRMKSDAYIYNYFRSSVRPMFKNDSFITKIFQISTSSLINYTKFQKKHINNSKKFASVFNHSLSSYMPLLTDALQSKSIGQKNLTITSQSVTISLSTRKTLNDLLSNITSQLVKTKKSEEKSLKYMENDLKKDLTSSPDLKYLKAVENFTMKSERVEQKISLANLRKKLSDKIMKLKTLLIKNPLT